tara:strand:- start:1476 stop:1721 length:246 start_codon:yes stop_codon:yes gene_type:complete
VEAFKGLLTFSYTCQRHAITSPCSAKSPDFAEQGFNTELNFFNEYNINNNLQFKYEKDQAEAFINGKPYPVTLEKIDHLTH